MRTIEISLKLNGQAKTWSIAPGEILLDVLRREGYVGAKRGCETGACGACTVLLNGKPIDACLMLQSGCSIVALDHMGRTTLTNIRCVMQRL